MKNFGSNEKVSLPCSDLSCVAGDESPMLMCAATLGLILAVIA